jgi:hypothetical protein
MADPQLRDVPRVSVNALAEYLTAGARRRRTIVVDQKRPKAFQIAYYTVPEAAIAASWAAGLDEGLLDGALERLRTLPSAKPWNLARKEAGLEAVASFREMLRNDAVPRLRNVLSLPRQSQAFSISGVSISVRPEILVQSPSSGSVAGGVKFYFSKTTPLASDRAEYVGTVLHMYVESLTDAATVADHRQCFVLDVFGRRLHSAPVSVRRRRRDVMAACAEIASMWDAA